MRKTAKRLLKKHIKIGHEKRAHKRRIQTVHKKRT